ncbi:hypothetical protein [Singulisphaera acidiphila]|uniref:Uncharacterized protein n=1 Tax=Singulisphaera acidiphila (strain ATCC BAA-1392 / DSM 18658 / VKM B-2454 / MOB10) TaxID=886293 RepID=L0DFP7_SINAD|nr:hypothetical protein [Singulisphaera acidiphila]AGA27680.1 hypothetical protein Sinac_3419 [Singulisphaera acidiphila DSM 18658]
MKLSHPTTRRSTSRRSRKVQKTFEALSDLGGEAVEPLPALDLNLKAFPYRTALANWPDEWRERWGHRANDLEEAGLGWREAEACAFFEVQEERRAEVGTPPLPLVRVDIGRTGVAPLLLSHQAMKL